MVKNEDSKNQSFKLGYVIPAIIITAGIIFSVRTFAEQSGGSPESNASSTLDELYDNLVTLGYGSDTGNLGAYWNRIKSASEWTPSGSVTANKVVSGETFYSNSRTQSTGTLILQNYINQEFVQVDDYDCANNNGENNTACVAGDSEYTGEESSWFLKATGGTTAASVTDNGVTVSLKSNKVYQDSLTGLYWSDSSASTVDNEFQFVNGDDPVNPTGTSCNLSSEGTANAYCDNQDPTNEYTEDNDVSAAEFCLNLQLDRDNADGDNNGLTGVETDWRLPSQKELLQAYIDGVGNNMPNVSTNFWSSTESYASGRYAWYTGLYDGGTYYSGKATVYSVHCVSRD